MLIRVITSLFAEIVVIVSLPSERGRDKAGATLLVGDRTAYRGFASCGLSTSSVRNQPRSPDERPVGVLRSDSRSCLGWVAESDGQPVIGIHQPDRDRQVGQFLFRERRRRRLEFAIRYSGVGDARNCFSPSQSRTFA